MRAPDPPRTPPDRPAMLRPGDIQERDGMNPSMAILASYFLAGLIGLVLLRARALQRGIDSPSRARRYLSRFFAYGFCNLLSCFISLALYGAFFDSGKFAMPHLALLLGPVPLAVLFYLGLTWTMRAANRRERSTLRKLGLAAPLAPAPTPPDVRSRATDFGRLDLHDPEIVREVARRHWQEINHALASDSDVTHAHDAQRQFLDTYVPTLEPALAARVSDLYMQESAIHLKEFARLSGKKRDRVVEHAQRTLRMARSTLILTVASIALALVLLLVKLLR